MQEGRRHPTQVTGCPTDLQYSTHRKLPGTQLCSGWLANPICLPSYRLKRQQVILPGPYILLSTLTTTQGYHRTKSITGHKQNWALPKDLCHCFWSGGLEGSKSQQESCMREARESQKWDEPILQYLHCKNSQGWKQSDQQQHSPHCQVLLTTFCRCGQLRQKEQPWAPLLEGFQHCMAWKSKSSCRSHAATCILRACGTYE